MIKPLTGKAQRSVELATARFNIWEGAVRSAKTVSSSFRWMEYVRQGPEGNLAMLGKTERTLKRNVIDPIIDLVGAKRARYLAGAGEFHLFGRRIYIAGANNMLAIEKIQGLTLAGAYGDEIATWPEPLWNMLGTRLSVPGAKFFGTCNPAGPIHWLKSEWLNRASDWLTHAGDLAPGVGDTMDLRRFSFTLDDNPHLDPEFVESLKRQYTGLFYRRYILGEWCLAEGVIYEGWDEARHVVDELPTITRWLCLAIDYGTTNPFHALLIGIGADGCLYVTHEWRWDSKKRQKALTDAEYSAEVRAWLTKLGIQPEWTIIDPSAASFRVQMYRDNWPSMLADNAVVDGIRQVASLLSTDRLKVHRRCAELIREIPAYSWDPDETAKGLDKPLKVDDHGVDGLRYGIHTTEAIWRQALGLAA